MVRARRCQRRESRAGTAAACGCHRPMAEFVDAARRVGGTVCDLPDGARAVVAIGALTFAISSVAGAARLPTPVRPDGTAIGAIGCVFASGMVFLSLIFAIPPPETMVGVRLHVA